VDVKHRIFLVQNSTHCVVTSTEIPWDSMDLVVLALSD